MLDQSLHEVSTVTHLHRSSGGLPSSLYRMINAALRAEHEAGSSVSATCSHLDGAAAASPAGKAECFNWTHISQPVLSHISAPCWKLLSVAVGEGNAWQRVFILKL